MFFVLPLLTSSCTLHLNPFATNIALWSKLSHKVNHHSQIPSSRLQISQKLEKTGREKKKSRIKNWLLDRSKREDRPFSAIQPAPSSTRQFPPSFREGVAGLLEEGRRGFSGDALTAEGRWYGISSPRGRPAEISEDIIPREAV